MSAIIREYLKEYYELREFCLSMESWEKSARAEELLLKMRIYPNLDVAMRALWNDYSLKEWTIAFIEIFPKQFDMEDEREEIRKRTDYSKIPDSELIKLLRLKRTSASVIDVDIAIKKLWDKFPPIEWSAIFAIMQGYNFEEINRFTGISQGWIYRIFKKISKAIAKELGTEYLDGKLYNMVKSRLGVTELTLDQRRFIRKIFYLVDSSVTETRYLKRRRDDRLEQI